MSGKKAMSDRMGKLKMLLINQLLKYPCTARVIPPLAVRNITPCAHSTLKYKKYSKYGNASHHG